MTQSSSIRSLVFLAGCLALVASGCKSSSSLALSAASTSQSIDDGGPDDSGVQIDAGGGINLCGKLLLDRVRVVVRRIDLERAPAAADAGDAGLAVCDCPDGGTVCVRADGDVHVGPFLVDLSDGDLDGGIHQVFDVEVPEGTYEDLRFLVDTVSRKQAPGDGGLAGMKDLHASIAADGTFAGDSFRFTTSIRVKQKQEGPFTVGPGTSSIVLAVDPAAWFVGAHGQLLDPRDLRNRGRILANIRCSIRMSSDTRADGGHVRRDFDDDEDEDRCRADDEDGDDHGGDHGDRHDDGDDGDHDGDHGEHHACLPAPALDCGDAGVAPDSGVDAGLP